VGSRRRGRPARGDRGDDDPQEPPPRRLQPCRYPRAPCRRV